MRRNIIAILRGVDPSNVIAITEILLDAGIVNIEIPLNSAQAFDSIAIMVEKFPDQGTFGAGTVTNIKEVQQLSDIGASMVVSPNCNTEVIRATKSAGMQSYPGVMTPSECFTALQAGADALKVFPGEVVTPCGLRAIRAVLPPATQCYAVGGVSPDNFADWLASGADGFGVGSALFKPDYSHHEIAQRSKSLVAAYDQYLEKANQ